MTTQLRYDRVPWQHFSDALHRQLADTAGKALIPEEKLRDIKIMARRNKQGNPELHPDPKKNRDFIFFFLRESDLVQQTIHHYIILHTDRDGSEELLRIAQRFRLDLRSKGIYVLFRIDPRHGAVAGSSMEPVSHFGARDRPGCFITLVCTRDAGHPLIALQDYVDREDRHRYHQLFEKYNHTTPSKPSLLKKMFKAQTFSSFSSGWTYPLISEITSILSSRYLMFLQEIFLIYENISDADWESCVIERKFSTMQTAGSARFFASTEELLQ